MLIREGTARVQKTQVGTIVKFKYCIAANSLSGNYFLLEVAVSQLFKGGENCFHAFLIPQSDHTIGKPRADAGSLCSEA